MPNIEYNGWTNYETWRVHLEMFDGMSCTDWGVQPSDDDDDRGALCVTALRDALESAVITQIEAESTGLARDYATAFLANVDWREIATSMLDDYTSTAPTP